MKQKPTTPSALIAEIPTTVHALLEHPDWDGFIGDKLGNGLFISDPDRANRILEAAEDGCDGSTHAEVIEDWREFAAILQSEASRALWGMDGEDGDGDRLEMAFAALEEDIARAEAHHEKAGTLHEVIG